MTKVVILIDNIGPQKAMAIASLRKIMPVSISSFTKCVGNDKPIFECNLSGNDHQDVALTLHQIMQAFDRHQVAFRMYHLDDNQKYDSSKRSTYLIMTRGILEKFLEAHDIEMRRQQDLAFEEAEGEQ